MTTFLVATLSHDVLVEAADEDHARHLPEIDLWKWHHEMIASHAS
ncbi:hypothetical protein AB1L42_15590 [Thalassoglobus sp. JC818]